MFTRGEGFPLHEVFGLTVRCVSAVDSSNSPTVNRFHNKEYKQFLYVALGSCAELETQIEIAAELEYLAAEAKGALLEKLDHETRMLRNLVKKLG
jgi:four helix bundle protein